MSSLAERPDVKALCESGRKLDALTSEVAHRLCHEPAWQVYADLIGSDTQLSPEDLERIGFPAELFAWFPPPARRLCFTPSLAGAQVVAESPDHCQTTLRLQWPSSPREVAVGLKVLRALLDGVDPALRFVVLMRPGGNTSALSRLVARWGHDPTRVSFHPHRARTLFARDNGLLLARGEERALLLPRSDARATEHNRLDPSGLDDGLGIRVIASRLHWDGGNLLFDGFHLLIGANTIALNCVRMGLSESEVLDAFAQELGARPVMLGDLARARHALLNEDGTEASRMEAGQADFHLDLDLCPLGRRDGRDTPGMAIASPTLGLSLSEAVLADSARFEDHFLSPDEMKAIYRRQLERHARHREQRLSEYRRELLTLGYELVDVPDLRALLRDDYLARRSFQLGYLNGLGHRAPDGPTVYLLRHGIDAVDDAAVLAYRSAGVHAQLIGDPVTSEETFTRLGGLHCLTSPMP